MTPHLRMLVKLTMIGIALTVLTGCETLTKVLDGMPKPTAQLTSVSITGISLTDTTVDMAVQVNNPYAVAIPNVTLDYALAAHQSDFASGKITSDKAIPAGGSSTIHVPIKVTYASVLQLASSIKPGQLVPYQAKATFSTQVPGVGPLRLPLQTQGQMPIPNVPKISVAKVHWDKISLSNTLATIDLNVTNLNAFPITLKNLNYSFDIAGKNVIESSFVEPVSFEQGQHQTLKIPIAFSATQFGLSGLNIIKSGIAKYKFTGNLEAQTHYGSLVMPVSTE